MSILRHLKHHNSSTNGSIWGDFGIDVSLDKIEKQFSGEDEYCIVLMELRNLGQILLTYGEETTKNITDRMCTVIKKELGSNSFVQQISPEYFLLSYALNDTTTVSKVSSIVNTLVAYGSSLDDSAVYLSVFSGVDVVSHERSVYDSFNRAFLALYSNRDGQFESYCTYDGVKDILDSQKNTMSMAAYFHNAMLNNQYALAFQPVIRSSDGNVEFYEALLRIKPENEKDLKIAPFISIAEQMGFITMVDMIVLRLVLKELHSDPNIMLSFNISNVTAESEEWRRKAAKLISDPSIGSRIIIELTETQKNRNLNQIRKFINTMQNLGCKIALDDFGVGYTSFTQLKFLDIDIVKIDGLFIRGLSDNAEQRLFVETLAKFAKGYGLKIAAEFVETGDVAKVLIEMGVEYLQGHYFSEALLVKPWLNKN